MMSLGVTEIFAEMVAVLPDVLLTMAFCPVGTFVRLQFPAVFQSVLVVPVQTLSCALATERPNEATKAVRMCVVNFLKFCFMQEICHAHTSPAIALSGTIMLLRLIFLI